MRVLFIDFEDSFSLNIMSELRIHQKLSKNHIDRIYFHEVGKLRDKDFLSYQLIVLGPGPGHPLEYEDDLKNFFHFYQHHKEVKVLGICLGHQILLKYQGYEVRKSRKPLHGESIEVKIEKRWKNVFSSDTNYIKVQRYNSLGVFESVKKRSLDQLTLSYKQEVIASINRKNLTFQFHPESIGSEHREIFFRNAINNHMENICEF